VTLRPPGAVAKISDGVERLLQALKKNKVCVHALVFACAPGSNRRFFLKFFSLKFSVSVSLFSIIGSVFLSYTRYLM